MMRTAFAKRALRADSRLALLGFVCLALFSASATRALASTTGGAAAKSATVSSEVSGAGASSGGAAPEPQLSKPTLATWFGPGFYGDETACGQTMSPTLLGVASRTLPCGTLVQIGYRGRHLTVPVVDRGPYGHIGAVWDLTAGTARALKVKETVHVTTEIVGSLPNTSTLGEPAETGLPSGEAAPASPGASTAPTAAASTGGAAAG
ncbi:MAG TPA: septal ring lytic transglycosylase RlpA family protein [Solirubrobacteraceae bacterium]|jgi:rare lipoprotein A (peptidoglycan hydrolase)